MDEAQLAVLGGDARRSAARVGDQAILRTGDIHQSLAGHRLGDSGVIVVLALDLEMPAIVLVNVQLTDAGDEMAEVGQLRLDGDLVHHRAAVGTAHQAEIVFLDVVVPSQRGHDRFDKPAVVGLASLRDNVSDTPSTKPKSLLRSPPTPLDEGETKRYRDDRDLVTEETTAAPQPNDNGQLENPVETVVNSG